MNEKHRIFCDEYVKTSDATASYQKAYPHVKKTTAVVNGSKLLSKTEINDYVKKRFKEALTERVADITETLELITKGMRGELEEEVVTTILTGNGTSEAVIVKKKIPANVRAKYIEMMGKKYSLFTDKVDIGGNVAVTIIDDIGTLKDEQEEN